MELVKYCKKCDVTKPTAEFSSKNGVYLSPCKACKQKTSITRKRRDALSGRAAIIGVPFNLSKEEVQRLYSIDNCHYCDYRITIRSIDRAVPELGYTKGNCIASCHWCNIFKSNLLTKEEMETVAPILRRRQERMATRPGGANGKSQKRRSPFSAKANW